MGTCAYDYSEKLKTEFVDCFDFNARRSSSVLLDNRYLIDCGDHTLDSLRIARVDFNSITDVFITHLHRDHYNKEHIAEIAKNKAEKLRLWVRDDAIVPEIKNVEIIKMRLKEQYRVNRELEVTGLLANHETASCPQHLLFEKDGKKFLYACDGAWFFNETYYHLKNASLDLLVLDATCGDCLEDYRIGEHNTIPMIRLMLPSLKTWGVITGTTEIFLSHLAPSLHKPHKETEEIVKADGLKVAYDGLKVIVK